MIACFYAGIAVGWLTHAAYAHKPSTAEARVERPDAVSTTGRAASSEPGRSSPDARGSAAASAPANPDKPAPFADPIRELRVHHLRLPLDDADVQKMKGGFDERRDGGGRGHEAVDILAPRNTPVHAVENGTIAKLFYSKAGGTAIYQFDPSGRFCYYYAHLERYADGLHDGQRVERGDVIGYVGTSGNAPKNTPHLHFAILKLNDDRRWWQGTPMDPYQVFRDIAELRD
jgi:murein DD-endopeptidase MepM/ murein hydrolase activator NlpD